MTDINNSEATSTTHHSLRSLKPDDIAVGSLLVSIIHSHTHICHGN